MIAKLIKYVKICAIIQCILKSSLLNMNFGGRLIVWSKCVFQCMRSLVRLPGNK